MRDGEPGDVPTTLLVCSRCRCGEPGDRPREGSVLAELLAALPASHIKLQPIACMSGCKRACAIGLQAPGKVSCLFGDLPPTSKAAAQAIELAQMHNLSATGYLLRNERPALLKESIPARIPPFEWAGGNEISWPTRATLDTRSIGASYSSAAKHPTTSLLRSP